jgi:hypothetical protein
MNTRLDPPNTSFDSRPLSVAILRESWSGAIRGSARQRRSSTTPSSSKPFRTSAKIQSAVVPSKCQSVMLADVRAYHLFFSRPRVRAPRVKLPRHFVFYRRRGHVIELSRLLHDASQLERHLPRPSHLPRCRHVHHRLQCQPNRLQPRKSPSHRTTLAPSAFTPQPITVQIANPPATVTLASNKPAP